MVRTGAQVRIAELVGAAVYLGFVLLAVLIAARALRDRQRATLDAALFIGAVGVMALVGLAIGPVGHAAPGLLEDVRRVAGLALPVLLLRVLDGFTPISPRLIRGVALALLPTAALALLLPAGALRSVVPAAYFVSTLSLGAWTFLRYASRTTGVTRRRMQAIGLGSAALVLVAALVILGRWLPAERPAAWQAAFGLGAFATALGYLLGVAPPAFIRRLWQYSALTEVLQLLATTPASLPLHESIPLLEAGIARAFGSPNAAILVWDEAQDALVSPGQRLEDYPDYDPREALVRRVFETQHAAFFADAPAQDPANEGLYRRLGSEAVLAAPIRTAAGPIGVLTLFSPRGAVFSAGDVPLVETVAQQVAAFFVRSEMVHQAVAVEAQAEANQLKEDFLAAAAHDLRTPLTGILGRAQLLLRRAERDPGIPPRQFELRALVGDAKRMQRLTEGLLEVSRAEQGRFTGDTVETDLRPIALGAVAMLPLGSHALRVVGNARAAVDAERLEQVLQNLIDNAVKFSPDGGEIVVTIDETANAVRIAVEDSGLGLSGTDLEAVFERFQRGSAAVRGRVAGMGVGLYLCRRVVEEHGGTIRAEQRAAGGARFLIELPRPPSRQSPGGEMTGPEEPASDDERPGDARASLARSS